MFSYESNIIGIQKRLEMIRLVSSSHFDMRFTAKMVKHLDTVMVWRAFSGEKECAGYIFFQEIPQ